MVQVLKALKEIKDYRVSKEPKVLKVDRVFREPLIRVLKVDYLLKVHKVH